jgi:NAD dependent epimerase/dehydratase
MQRHKKRTNVNWKGVKVLITGAGGFIGSHLVDEMVKKEADVTALVHYNSRNEWGMLEGTNDKNNDHLQVIMGDITDSAFTQHIAKGQEYIFHLAALIGIPYSYHSPESYINTNIKGTLNILEAGRKNNVYRIIHTSTSEVYGTAQYTPIDEKHPLQGQSPYSASKIGADKIAESYHYAFNLPVAILRPFNTFGPRQSSRAIIPTIITQALTSDIINLGSLTPVRDLTYVNDTIRAFIFMAECDEAIGTTINVGRGSGISIKELAEKILDKVNPAATVICNEERMRPSTSEVMMLICDNTRAAQLLDWKPNISFEEGLDRTIEWMRDHITYYKPQMYTI